MKPAPVFGAPSIATATVRPSKALPSGDVNVKGYGHGHGYGYGHGYVHGYVHGYGYGYGYGFVNANANVAVNLASGDDRHFWLRSRVFQS